MLCPASMCDLLNATKGSSWTGEKAATCPEHSDLNNGGCPWWEMGCREGQTYEVSMIKIPVVTSNKQIKCRNSDICSWKQNSPTGVCAPELAIRNGFNPQICNF